MNTTKAEQKPNNAFRIITNQTDWTFGVYRNGRLIQGGFLTYNQASDYIDKGYAKKSHHSACNVNFRWSKGCNCEGV